MSMLFFVLVGIYVIFMLFVMKQTIKRVKKYQIIIVPSAFIVLLLIPTWDYILGKQVFDEYCKNEAGLHIYEDVQKVDSIYVKNETPYFYLDRYKFVEGKEDAKYYKYYIDINTSSDCTEGCYSCNKLLNIGECFAKVEIEIPLSFYNFFNISGHISPSQKSEQVSDILNIKKYTSSILYELKTNKKIAEVINYEWNRGWFFRMSSLHNIRCNYKLNSRDELILKTAKDKR